MTIVLQAIGVVHSSRREVVDDDWNREQVHIELDARFGPEAFAGLETFSHVEVVFYFHKHTRVNRGAAHPRGNPKWPLVGVLAGHSPIRPNHLGVSRCALLNVNGLELTVQGLDAIDGTPIMDIKPYTVEFYPNTEVREPAWMHELMAHYY